MPLPVALRARLKGTLRLAAAGVGTLLTSRAHAPRVITYHGVCPHPIDEWSVTPVQLRTHMEIVARDCHPVSLGDIVAWLCGERSLPPRAVAVTFDDGFLDVLTYAAPILAEHAVPGAVFVAPALTSRGAGAAHPSFQVNRPLLAWADVRSLLAAGWTIGSHANSHPILASLSEAEARSELSASRECLEQRLGVAVDLLAYPYGTPATVSARDVQLAREVGYRAAFMSVTAPLQTTADLHALPRSKVLASDGRFEMGAILDGRLDAWSRVERSH